MDPDEALRQIRAAMDDIDNPPDVDTLMHSVNDLMTHVRALDEWLSKSGFLPADWQRHRDAGV